MATYTYKDWMLNHFTRMYPIQEFEPCSDEDFWEAIHLAHASFWKHQNVSKEELSRIFVGGKPITYWIAKLEKKSRKLETRDGSNAESKNG